MREEINRLFNRFFGRGGNHEAATWDEASGHRRSISMDPRAFMLKAELPGFTKRTSTSRIQGDQLILRGRRRRETEAKKEQYHGMERAYGRFRHAFWLPTTVGFREDQATFKWHVELRLPKSEAAKPKRIAILKRKEPPRDGSKPTEARSAVPQGRGGRGRGQSLGATPCG